MTPSTTHVMHLSAAILGGDSGDIHMGCVGFGEFCWQFLARDGGIGWIVHFLAGSLGKDPEDL